MPDTFNIPKIGPVKKGYVYAGGAAVGGYVAWRWWTAGTSAPIEEEETVPPPESVGTIGADIGSGEGGYYYPRPDGTDGPSDGDPGDTVMNNMQWSARALEWLVNAGYTEMAASNALGKYLAGEDLSASEQIMIQVAIAFVGEPPHPPAEKPPTTPPEPSAVGTPRNLRSGGGATQDAIPLRWDAVSGAAGYQVYRDGANVGATSSTSYTVRGLDAGESYAFTVRARNSAGTTGPESNTYTGRTDAAPKPEPSGGTPPHRTVRITRRNQSLSELVAEHNRRHGGPNPSWREVWEFNLRYRSPSTVKTLRKRGPHKTYIGSAWWIPTT